MRDPIRTIPKSKPTLNDRSGMQPNFPDRCSQNTLELLIGAVRQRRRSGCSQNILDNLVGFLENRPAALRLPLIYG